MTIWTLGLPWTIGPTQGDESMFGKDTKVWLVCLGIDTVANISVNGHFVGMTTNQFKRYSFDIKDVSHASVNSIAVAFESAATYSIRQARNYPYNIPSSDPYFNAKRNFIRECQSDFGWDWGPALVPIGIWKNIRVYLKRCATDHS
eukprot:m.96584 g.96584  ORF g.96584 m.96584 type:complete len:146 (+) comp36913_c0_seq6:300-737(+)